MTQSDVNHAFRQRADDSLAQGAQELPSGLLALSNKARRLGASWSIDMTLSSITVEERSIREQNRSRQTWNVSSMLCSQGGHQGPGI